jgi:hypothetical protein
LRSWPDHTVHPINTVIFSECPAATLPRHAPRRRRGSGLAHGRPRAAGPTARTRIAMLAAYNEPSTGVSGSTLPHPAPAPTRHTAGSTSDNHPANAATSRTFRPKATRAQRKRDLGAQVRPRRPNPHRTTAKSTQLPFMNRVSNDFPYTGPPGPPSLVFVLCFVCLFVCLSVCLYVIVYTRNSLGHPAASQLLFRSPWTPPSAILNVPLVLNASCSPPSVRRFPNIQCLRRFPTQLS